MVEVTFRYGQIFKIIREVMASQPFLDKGKILFASLYPDDDLGFSIKGKAGIACQDVPRHPFFPGEHVLRKTQGCEGVLNCSREIL